jgi:hypothetical protein
MIFDYFGRNWIDSQRKKAFQLPENYPIAESKIINPPLQNGEVVIAKP